MPAASSCPRSTVPLEASISITSSPSSRTARLVCARSQFNGSPVPRKIMRPKRYSSGLSSRSMRRVAPGDVRFDPRDQIEANPTPSVTIFSDTAREVPLADVLQEPLRGLLHKIQDTLEAIRSAVVGVRHLPLRRFLSEVEKRPHHCGPPA